MLELFLEAGNQRPEQEDLLKEGFELFCFIIQL